MAILMFVVSGLLIVGGAITLVAGAIVAGREHEDLAQAGFVVGGSGMILAGAGAFGVGYLLYPIEEQSPPPAALRTPRLPTLGPSITVRF